MAESASCCRETLDSSVVTHKRGYASINILSLYHAVLYGGCWVRRRKDSVQWLKCRIEVRPNMAFLFSINYPKCKVSNSISLQVLLATSYPVQYLGAGSSFQKKWARTVLYANLLSSSHSHLDWNGFYLMLEDFWEGNRQTATSHQLLL